MLPSAYLERFCVESPEMHEVVKLLLEREYAPQRSKEWYTMRESVITASDAGSLMGLNYFKSRQKFIREKCGYFYEGDRLVSLDKKPDTSSEATRHGVKYEGEARDYYVSKTGEVVHEIGLAFHPVYPWIAGSPDGITESGRLLEIKCPLNGKIDCKISDLYFVQVQLLMEILNLEVTDFVKYRPGPVPEYTCFQVHRDRDWFQRALPILEDGWEEIKARRKYGLCEITPENDQVCGVQEVGGCTSGVQDVQPDVLPETHTSGVAHVPGTGQEGPAGEGEFGGEAGTSNLRQEETDASVLLNDQCDQSNHE